MKPVDRTDLDGILDRKSILLLNQTYLATSYIEFLVTQIPSNVASKKGTCLPLEMWFEILKFARDMPAYRLVQPQTIRQGKEGPELICYEINERESCCEIEDGSGVWVWESYLEAPYVQLHERTTQEEIPRPFQLPNTGSDAESVVVSLSPYNSQLGSLFHDVTVPDIIAWLPDEDWCGVCQGGILIEAEGWPGTEITAKFVGAQTWAWGDAFCPLCIGIDDCERCMVHNEYLENFGGDEEESEDEEVSREKEEHKSWMQSRRKELGNY